MANCKNWKRCLEEKRKQVYEETKYRPQGYEEKRDILNIAEKLKKECEECHDNKEEV